MRPHHYRFVNEGVASIVFACHDGDLNGRVIRIPKQPYHDPDRDDQARQRITSIFSALFGPEYILHETMVMIPCDVLRTLLAEARGRRSQLRADVFDVGSIPEVGAWPAWAMDDMTRVGPQSLFTIELKPKWGFLLAPGEHKTHLVQSRICRNCLYQCLKRHQGRVTQISHYCPLDLFHSDPRRRRRALAQMLETPQNNFVVFDGRGVCLADESERPLADAELIGLAGAVISEHLPLMARIQRSQRLTSTTLGRVRDLLNEIEADQWDRFVADPLSADIAQRLTSTLPFTLPCALQDFPDCLRDADAFAASGESSAPAVVRPDADVHDVLTTLRLVLLEMTARDVSLMMTFTSADDGQRVQLGQQRAEAPPIRDIEFAGRRWQYKIAVVDLETKYPRKIRHWVEVENDMLTHFMDVCARNANNV